MNRKRRIYTTLMAAALVVTGIASLFARPATNVLAESPTAVPTQMSNTLISVEVSKPTVNPGDAFDLNITMSTDAQTLGAQFALQFDPALVELDSSFVEGGFYKDYAQAHSGTFLLLPQPQIDNATGKVNLTGLSVVGLQVGSGGPTGKGVLITFHGKAKTGAQGVAQFILSKIIVSDIGDANGNTAALGGVMAQDGVLSIGGPAAPTLAPRPADADISLTKTAPTAVVEPTVVKRTSLNEPAESGNSIPWIFILPVVAVVVVGAGAFVVLRKK
jgi:hypothetical protein